MESESCWLGKVAVDPERELLSLNTSSLKDSNERSI